MYQGCGILASYLGTLIEGEIMLLTSVISAKMGLFNYYWGLVAAFFGAYTKAWIKYMIARKQGAKLLNKKPALKAKLDNASSWFDKRPYTFLSVYKFMYGMSTVVILMSGIKKISYLRFGIHAAIGIFLWVAVIGSLGYFCAEAMMENINKVTDYKFHIIGVMIVLGLGVWFFKHHKHDKHHFTVAE